MEEAEKRAQAKAKTMAGMQLGRSNLDAMVAFEAMQVANEERGNLRSMQAWLAVKVGRDQQYLSYPPTEDYPEGFGSMREFLKAAGITGTTVYALDGLAMEVAPMLEAQGYEVGQYLTRGRYPKLAEAMSQLRRIARGQKTEYELAEIMADVERATNRNDIRQKYRQQAYVADGAVNNLGSRSVLTIVANEERVQSLLNSLASKVDWHAMSATAEERNHEIVLRLPKSE
jgi:hypothetical protein